MAKGKRSRVFSHEFKLDTVQRMLDGESPTTLASELKILRKMLYQWKDAYLSGGAAALRPLGRPRKDQDPNKPPVPKTKRGELLQARQRIAELERKVGRQQLEIDFFEEALRRVKAAQEEEDRQNASCYILGNGSLCQGKESALLARDGTDHDSDGGPRRPTTDASAQPTVETGSAGAG